jgi:hypothetical protein
VCLWSGLVAVVAVTVAVSPPGIRRQVGSAARLQPGSRGGSARRNRTPGAPGPAVPVAKCGPHRPGSLRLLTNCTTDRGKQALRGRTHADLGIWLSTFLIFTQYIATACALDVPCRASGSAAGTCPAPGKFLACPLPRASPAWKAAAVSAVG